MKTFAELTAREKSIETLRWIAVLPTALLSGFVVSMIAGSLKSLTSIAPALHSLSNEFPLAAALVIVGARTAPRFRIAAAIALAALWITVSVASHLVLPDRLGLSNWLDVAFASASAVAAAAFVYFRESAAQRRKSESTIE